MSELENRPDLQAYHQSIASELYSIHKRIRQLIGHAHWLTDGEYKEAILRRVLRNHVPEVVRVGTGFVCFPRGETSHQLDILLTDTRKPTLFKDEGLVIVTADTVRAVIEVKTKLTPVELQNALAKLGRDVAHIRQENPACMAGLFVYEPGNLDDKKILKALHAAAEKDGQRVINFVAAGAGLFAQYSEYALRGKGGKPPLWYAYNLNDLAPAYFLSHFAWRSADERSEEMRFAWFPLRSDIKNHTTYSISLDENRVRSTDLLF